MNNWPSIPPPALKHLRINWPEFAGDLRAFRARKQLDLRSLAALLKMSPASLSRIENGRPTDADLFMRLAVWIDVDPRAYIRWDEPESEDEHEPG